MLNRVKHKPIMAKVFFSDWLQKEMTANRIAITAEANMKQAKGTTYSTPTLSKIGEKRKRLIVTNILTMRNV